MINFFDRVLGSFRARASTLGGQAGSILLNLVGFASSDTDADGEVSAGEPVFGVPGVFCRPLDADGNGEAEYIAARHEDGLFPMAGRDLRITTARGNVDKGTTTLGGYGGAHITIAFDQASGQDVVTIAHRTGTTVVIGTDGKVTINAPLVSFTAGSDVLPFGQETGRFVRYGDMVSIPVSGAAAQGPIKQPAVPPAGNPIAKVSG